VVLTLFSTEMKKGGGGHFFLDIYLSWVEIRLYAKFHNPGVPRRGRFMVGDKTATTNSIEIMASLAPAGAELS
jgi:hypothetical protein